MFIYMYFLKNIYTFSIKKKLMFYHQIIKSQEKNTDVVKQTLKKPLALNILSVFLFTCDTKK